MDGPFPTITEHVVRRALALTDFDGRAAQRPMEPATRGIPPARADAEAPRDAGALAYVFEADGQPCLPITLRRESLREHSGQVSLPGGRPEAGEDLWQTALREAREEIGLEAAGADRLGVLAPVYIPVTHTRMFVHVAWGPAPAALIPSPDEVVRVEVMPLGHLLSTRRRATTRMHIAGRDLEIPYFDVADLRIWGATAMALSELAERLRLVLPA